MALALSEWIVDKILCPDDIELRTAVTASALRTSESKIHFGFCLIHVTNTSVYEAILLVFIATISRCG